MTIKITTIKILKIKIKTIHVRLTNKTMIKEKN